MNSLPKIIQGGMGAGVSSWQLACAVSSQGGLGVVSGTALDHILARRLQDGDPGGHMRRALYSFPDKVMAERVWNAYYIAGGKAEKQSYKTLPMHEKDMPHELVDLCIVSNFVEVWLAKEGHANPVGINFLEKIQLPHLPSIYGAMLAGVDYVLMGAGVPLKIPGVLDHFAAQEEASYPLYVTGAYESTDTLMTFNPRHSMQCELTMLKRPKFLAIIASNTLATTLVKKANGHVDGFIIEGPTAGGHNAPPRGKMQLNESGEPVYGERDSVDLAKIKELGLPFWLAGGYGTPEKLQEALAAGAAGIQMGTAFALCEESGLRADYKQTLRAKVKAGTAEIFTDPNASPTGFPFKVARLEGSLSEENVYKVRPRICDIGMLREAYRKDDGTVGFRCSGEPTTLYISKGGKLEDTVGRKCLCNALVANIGQPQIRNGKYLEQGLVTAGDDLAGAKRFLSHEDGSLRAVDVIEKMMSKENQNNMVESIHS